MEIKKRKENKTRTMGFCERKISVKGKQWQLHQCVQMHVLLEEIWN